MHVGLNLIYLVPGETGGTEIYARELIPELVAAAPHVRFTAFVNLEASAVRDAPWGGLVAAATVPVRGARRSEWVRAEQQLLPNMASRAGVDLVHSLANTGPGWGRFRRVVTIHDLNHRLVPEAHIGMLGIGMRVAVEIAVRRSSRIIVDATSTRDDLHRLMGTPSNKVDVVPLGVGVAQSKPLPEGDVRRQHALRDRRIVLTVSAKRPHKNLMRLTTALSLIPVERRPILVLVGYSTRHEDELRKHVAELGIVGDVRLLGWVEQPMLEGLYAAAGCFAFPSLYEGFGLPVLEAMARGVPVICSDRGSLAEVAGDAAIRVDPRSEAAIAAAIDRILGDQVEAERLRAAGAQQAARFSWAATAAGTLASYERTMASAP